VKPGERRIQDFICLATPVHVPGLAHMEASTSRWLHFPASFFFVRTMFALSG